VESSCELGNEPSGSIKCWELPNGCTSCGLSSGTQLHRVSLLVPHIMVYYPTEEITGLNSVTVYGKYDSLCGLVVGVPGC
jgi:hypothetical protein